MSGAASPQGGSLQSALIPESPPQAAFLPTNTSDFDMPSSSQVSPAPQFARSKYTSPAPLPRSSITPPPSSQVPIKHVPRTPSPPTSQLTSPPPTVQLPPYHPSSLVEIPSTEQISNGSVDDLRTMVENLSFALRESRASAAHFKLQYNMLVIDSSEATKRMEVELQLAQREIEVLQEAEERHKQDYISPAQQAGTSALIEDLNRQSLILQSENEQLRDMLVKTTQTLEDTDGALASLREENSRLRHRIRTNRDHMNGILDTVSDGSPRSLLNTPHQTHLSTPQHPTSSRPMNTPGRERGAFEALLLADKVLNSQETATAPSTPKTSPLRHRLGHVRNTHSLSSLPTTPIRKPLAPNSMSALRTPPYLATILEPASVGQARPPHFVLPASEHKRRRASSDSTITASSVDEETQKHPHSEDEDAVPESQASQRAASLLRRTPGSSQQSSNGPKLSQSRIMGQVTRPAMVASDEKEKRRLTGYGVDQGSPSKRGRIGVGLGIGIPEHR